MTDPAAATVSAHPLDRVSLGKIVQIRETLLRAQAKGARVIRFESGDPSFSVAPHVLAAIGDAGAAGKTHYVPNDGIPELRRALADKLRTKNCIADILSRIPYKKISRPKVKLPERSGKHAYADEKAMRDRRWVTEKY